MNKFFKSTLLTTVLILTSIVGYGATFEYHLGMSQPHTHYYEVTVDVKDLKKDYIDFKMPVWAPGSYLVREFARHVESFKALNADGKELNVEIRNKNTWRVSSKKASHVKITYRVYAFEMSVRTSFLDASHGYLNGTSIFVYADGYKNSAGTLKITPPSDWKQISTGLKQMSNKWEYEFPNYDILGDSPIEIGNHKIFDFTASGVKHYVAMYGEGNYDVAKLQKDMAKIVEACTDVFGVNPNKEYTFIIHNLTQGSGGLEHLNSTTLQVNRWTYSGSAYHRFLSLVAHEYFHLWNVKRVRPITLGPFDYEGENYTNLLWVMEGFTSYYDELLMQRAGFYTNDRYLRVLAGTMTRVENQPGNKVQPVSESSFHAWIKAYRTNENSYNTNISYYSKGSLVAAMLDLLIMKNTKGEKNLDDVMQALYNEFYLKKGRGFTADEMQSTVEKVAGMKLEEFFNKHIHGTEMLPYSEYVGFAGLNLIDRNKEKTTASLGVKTKTEGKNTIVTTVIREKSSYVSGINVNDELVAIDGFRIGPNSATQLVNEKKPGDEIIVTVSRDGILMEIPVKLIKNNALDFKLKEKEKPTKEEQKVFTKMLGEE
jgi:predicted metalloprotease with PDZ domain